MGHASRDLPVADRLWLGDRHQADVIAYLVEENLVLKGQVGNS